MSETTETTPVDQAAVSAEKREGAGVGTQSEDQYVAALLEERRGYETFGRGDRVAEVDEQLALRGHKAAGEARAAAAPKATRGRGTKPQQTA